MTYNANLIKGNRIVFLDNLRTLMIFLVILVHAGFVYNGMLYPVWIVNDFSPNYLSFILFLIIDIFMMPALFFISGYFAPLSFETNKGLKFFKSKFKRLYVPWILAVFTLIPLYRVIFLYSRNLPQADLITYFHFNKGFVSQNWLWFLPVLFLFNGLYFLISVIEKGKSEIPLKGAALIIFIIGLGYTLAMNIMGAEGWTLTPVLDFQNERLLIYFMIFLAGALCYRKKVFEINPGKKRLYFIVSSVIWIPVVVYILFKQNSLIHQGKYIISPIADGAIMSFSYNLSLPGLLYVLINTFRYYLNRETGFVNVLNKNSYGVYIIHMIVMGGLALTMLHIKIPSLVKYGILTVTTFAVSNLVIYIYRKIRQTIKVRVLYQPGNR